MDAASLPPPPQTVSPLVFGLIILATTACFILPLLVMFPPMPVSVADVLRPTHTRAGVREQQQQPAGREGAPQHGPPTIRSLFIYPIKSCRGIELSRGRVGVSGLEHDRLYTFAVRPRGEDPDGAGTGGAGGGGGAVGAGGAGGGTGGGAPWEFITQRQVPLLATLQIDLWVPDAAGGDRESFFILRFPRQSAGSRLGRLLWLAAAKLSRWDVHAAPEVEIMLPVAFPGDDEIGRAGYAREPVRIWRDTVDALNLEPDLPPELGRYLGIRGRLGLFRMDPRRRRPVFRNAPRREEAGYQPVVDFQDGYPLNLINLHSVQDLDSRTPKDEHMADLDIRRFRANIVVSGVPAWEEETWKLLGLKGPSGARAEGAFYVVCRCVRCKLPNVHPTSGHRHPAQPDRTIRQYRGGVDSGAPNLGCLGMQLCPGFADEEAGREADGDAADLMSSMSFTVEVGMIIDVLETGEHVYISK